MPNDRLRDAFLRNGLTPIAVAERPGVGTTCDGRTARQGPQTNLLHVGGLCRDGLPTPRFRERHADLLLLRRRLDVAAVHRAWHLMSYLTCCRRTISVIQMGANGDVQFGGVG